MTKAEIIRKLDDTIEFLLEIGCYTMAREVSQAREFVLYNTK